MITSASLRERPAAIAGQRQIIEALGPETATFLQGQLSQDVASMAPGESRWSLLLHPQGKIASWLRITRAGDDRFLLDVDAGWADETVARLVRFKLRTKCELAVLPWTSLTVVGAGAADVTILGAELVIDDRLGDLAARVAFGANPAADVDVLPAEVALALRIEAGRPAMGAELDDSTIPAAAGIVDQSVSFTKGCYTGQELVARIDSRGNNVPRRLVGLVFDATDTSGADAAPEAGATVTVDEDQVGQVTSAAHSALLKSPIALAYVGRVVELDTVVMVDGRRAEVRELPLVRG